MAKRKRLTPATGLSESVLPETETHTGAGFGPRPGARAPIADVAGQAAAQAALETLADEVARNRREGRVVQSLPLQSVVEDHMVRDRMSQDAGDQAVLEASLRTRGQQTPIEVVEIAEGRYGLISGWRRLHALRRLHAETGEARFAAVQALIKPVETVSDGYVAMVEENEIRANLSFYERARLACEAARLGVYPTPSEAVRVLFAHAPAAKRSKINSFVRLCEALGAHLAYPETIPEKLGLSLVSALEREDGFARRLKEALRKSPPADAAAERRVLERVLRPPAPAAAAPEEVAPGVRLQTSRGRIVLSGKGITPDLAQALREFLAGR